MNYAITHLSTVPVRSSASDTSEMVTQLLFGEIVEILDKKSQWRRIRCTWDNYIGWIDHKQIRPISQAEYEQYINDYAYSLELMQPVMADDHYIPITMGARLPCFDGMRLQLCSQNYSFSGQAVHPSDIDSSVSMILKIARKYLYAPYLWGGRSPVGIDCSGFTQIVYQMAGISLLRDASQQVGQGESVDFVEQALPGDLAFFENKKGNISHVGIIISEDEIIHASGRVRIDKIDHYGIYNIDTKKYTHPLRVVKRVIANSVAPQKGESAPTEQAFKQAGLF